MVHHWDGVKQVFGLLVYMLKHSDPDGVELCFTSSPRKYKSKTTTRLPKQLEKKNDNLRGHTNMGSCLSSVIQGYQEKLDSQAHQRAIPGSWWAKVRSLSIYILTDGNWQPRDDSGDLIRTLVAKLKERGKNRSQAGVQFIQFGQVAEATRRLEYLDAGLDLGKW